MTYTVSSGTLNSSIPYHTILLSTKIVFFCEKSHNDTQHSTHDNTHLMVFFRTSRVSRHQNVSSLARKTSLLPDWMPIVWMLVPEKPFVFLVNKSKGFVFNIPVIFIFSIDIAKRCIEKLAYKKTKFCPLRSAGKSWWENFELLYCTIRNSMSATPNFFTIIPQNSDYQTIEFFGFTSSCIHIKDPSVSICMSVNHPNLWGAMIPRPICILNQGHPRMITGTFN